MDMESNRQLIEAVLHYSCSFKPTKQTQSNLSNTYQQIHDSQIISQSISTWIQLVRVHCPQILNYYPEEKYSKYYNEEVCLIDANLKFKGSSTPALKYTLIKSKKQVKKFTHHYNKVKAKEHHKEQVTQNIFDILSHYTLAKGNAQQKLVFEDFIEQIAPHEKWDIRVLGQYKVSFIEQGSVKSCMNSTVCRPCQRFNKFYLTITNECILFSDQTLVDGIVEQAIPYTYALKVNFIETVGHRFVARIVSGKTQLQVAFQDLHDLIKFSYTFNQIKKTSPFYFNLDPEIKSFSPQRQNNWTKFYNDGESYFSDLYDQIERAQKKICITGWCITPYLLLKRPQSIQTGKSRLDRTLGRAAKRGVKIFIIVFQEPSLFVNNDSFNVWSMFQNMSQNFKVLRHPGLIIPQLWSHHEKSVIIDEKVAFMGGLDICYGRWDTHDHPINDNQKGLWDGADYNNERQRSITEPRNFTKSNLDRVNEPRMPWHDIALQLKGPAVIDLQRHFCQYWYFAIRDLTDDPRDHLRNFKTRYDELKRQQRERKQQDQQLFNKKKPTQSQLHAIQIKYANEKRKDTNQEDYTFADRVRHAKQAFQDIVQNKQSTTSKQIIVEGFCVNDKPGNMNLRLCRSSCTWSTGISQAQKEHSIYDAYLKLIGEAKQFIYIENQFFMSYENLISQQIAARIIRAYERKQSFKVVVMMPLLPGFEGDPTNQNSAILRAQMQLQFEAISRHKDSIFQIIEAKNQNIKISDYIYFFGVRNHGLFGPNKDIPKTEIIYVHSKLMIVDDRHMIIGSANINDRSLLGNRDSQLAMVIEDPQGSYGKGSIFDFRCSIFKEHFGMDEGNCRNLNRYWNKLIDIAKNNTQIYRQVFGCYPDNKAQVYADVIALQRKANNHFYFQKIKNLYGHYVQWPIHFLKKENLSIKFGQKQFIAPITFFT